MSEELFGRVVVVQVGDLQIRNLRMAFQASRSDKPEPNTATVTIYNLKEENRTALSKQKRAPVLLSAGYNNAGGLILSGEASIVQHTRQGPDWVTRLECGDKAHALGNAHASVSLAKGTSAKEVVLALVKSIGAEKGNIEAALGRGGLRQGLTGYPSGYSCRGKASAALDSVLGSLGLEWSVQDGRMQILRPSEVAEGQALLISESSGLIGSPEYGLPDATKGGPPTLKFKCLLQHRLRPGVKVALKSRSVSGVFKCQKVTHQGDTHGQEFTSECEALAVKG